MIQAVDSTSGTITRSYDGLDRLISEVTPQGSVSYSYDAAGRRTSMSVSGQSAISYSYDNANRLTQITQGGASVTIVPDSDSRRQSLTLPNGVKMAYGYDAASQLTGITYTQGSNTLGNLSYAYDLAGRRTNVGGSFARTGVPQAVSSATYNVNNQLTNWKGTGLTYDVNGNLTNDGTNTYNWNARNQLVSISGAVNATFQYDAFGRRVSKTIGGTTQYLYDGVNPVQEISGTSAPVNLLTGGVDEYFQRTDSAGARNFLTDALGSTLALADSTGTVQTSYTFEPFGNTTASGSATANSFAFTGRELDSTGLYFYRARYYNPSLQRFIGEDPLGFASNSVNFYELAYQDPTSLNDPSGLQPIGFDSATAVSLWFSAQSPCTQARIGLGARGALNLAIGIGKVAVGIGVTAETGGFGAVLGYYSIVGGLVGNIGGGIIQIADAINGNLEEGELGADAAAASSSVLGLVTLAATGGNIKKAGAAAQIEGVGLTAFGSGYLGEAPSLPDVLDSGQNAYDFINPGQKPTNVAGRKNPAKCPQ